MARLLAIGDDKIASGENRTITKGFHQLSKPDVLYYNIVLLIL